MKEEHPPRYAMDVAKAFLPREWWLVQSFAMARRAMGDEDARAEVESQAGSALYAGPILQEEGFRFYGVEFTEDGEMLMKDVPTTPGVSTPAQAGIDPVTMLDAGLRIMREHLPHMKEEISAMADLWVQWKAKLQEHGIEPLFDAAEGPVS